MHDTYSSILLRKGLKLATPAGIVPFFDAIEIAKDILINKLLH
jgi:hypothetical protein